METDESLEENQVNFQGLQKKVGGYVLGHMLGEGRFSQIFQATQITSGEKVAVKVVCKVEKQVRNDSHFRSSLRKEATILRNLHHPNIIELYEVLETTNNYYMVLEVVDKGALTECLIFRSGFEEQEARHIFRQLVSAVEYLHRKGVVHRRITPDNILFDAGGKVKLTGFRSDRQHLLTYSSTEHERWDFSQFIAPQLLHTNNNVYSTKGDIWSLGVNLNLMLTGALPFTHDSCWFASNIYKAPEHMSRECRDLLRKLIAHSEEERISMDAIFEHEWITGNQEPLTPWSDSLSSPGASINHNVVSYMVNQYKFNQFEVLESIRENRINHACATYRLLLRKFNSRDATKSLPYKNLDLQMLDGSSNVIDQYKNTSSLLPPAIEVSRADMMHYYSVEEEGGVETETSDQGNCTNSGIEMEIGVSQSSSGPSWTGKVTITTSRLEIDENGKSREIINKVLGGWGEVEKKRTHEQTYREYSYAEPRDVQWSRQLAKKNVSFPSIKTISEEQDLKLEQRQNTRDNLLKIRNFKRKQLPKIKSTKETEIRLDGNAFTSRSLMACTNTETPSPDNADGDQSPEANESPPQEKNPCITNISSISEIFSCNSFPPEIARQPKNKPMMESVTDSISQVLTMKKLATRFGKKTNHETVERKKRNKDKIRKLAKEISRRNETTSPTQPRVPPNSAFKRKPIHPDDEEKRKLASMNLLFNFQLKLDKCEDEFYEKYKFKTRFLDSDKQYHHHPHDNNAMPRKGVSKRRARSITKEIQQYGPYNPYDKELLASSQKLSCYYSLPDIRKQIQNGTTTLLPSSVRHHGDSIHSYTWSTAHPVLKRDNHIIEENAGSGLKLPQIVLPK